MYQKAQEIYKTSCEKNMVYPETGSSSYFTTFSLESKLNKYNEDADICYNDNGIVDFNCNSFYHKDKHTDYDETSSCETHIGPGTRSI